jgi:hypothetical protein
VRTRGHDLAKVLELINTGRFDIAVGTTLFTWVGGGSLFANPVTIKHGLGRIPISIMGSIDTPASMFQNNPPDAINMVLSAFSVSAISPGAGQTNHIYWVAIA